MDEGAERCRVELTHYPACLDGPAGDHLAGVLSAVAAACARRRGAGADEDHDDRLAPADFEAGIVACLMSASRVDDLTYCRRMVQIAALAVAAVQRWDRSHGRPGGNAS